MLRSLRSPVMRRYAVVVLAVGSAFGMIGAFVAPVGAAGGTVLTTCSTLTGTATYSPALPIEGDPTTVVPNITVTGTISGCAGGGVTGGTFSFTGTATKAENCTTVVNGSNPASGTETITWNTGQTSTVVASFDSFEGSAVQSVTTGTVTAGLFVSSTFSVGFTATAPNGQCASVPGSMFPSTNFEPLTIKAGAPGTSVGSCATVTGTGTFSPPLPAVGDPTTVTPTITDDFTIGGCVGGDVTSATAVLTATAANPENCATSAKGNPYIGTEAITWNNGQTSTAATSTSAVPGHSNETVTVATVTAGEFYGSTVTVTTSFTLPPGACTAGMPLATLQFAQVSPLVFVTTPVKTTFAGYEAVPGAISAATSASTQITLPKIVCVAGETAAIDPDVQVSYNSAGAQAGVRLRCVNGKPTYQPTMNINGTRTFPTLIVKAGDKINESVAQTASGTTILLTDMTTNKTVKRTGPGGASYYGFVGMSDVAKSTKPPVEFAAPNFGHVTFTAAKINGVALGSLIIATFDMYSGSSTPPSPTADLLITTSKISGGTTFTCTFKRSS